MKWALRNQEPEKEFKELRFQALDWYSEDLVNDDTGYSEYKIFIFGINESGIPINLRIDNFYPFFFIEVPTTWDQTCIYSIKEAINNKCIKSYDFLQRKKYYGFENNKIRKFIKLTFYSSQGMKSVKYAIEKKKYVISGKEYSFQLYESHIDPILRFTHLRDILTAGWIRSNKFLFNESYYTADWKSIEGIPEKNNDIADFRLLYFDIEACSEDGSFPDPKKPNDKVTQICCIIKDSRETTKYLFNLGYTMINSFTISSHAK
jgi:DNA polymerase elongation subunit (family B)